MSSKQASQIGTDHLVAYDKECLLVLRAWAKTPFVWRIVFSFFPRRGWKFCIRAFGNQFPLNRSSSTWFLEQIVFNSHERMIRIGEGRWDEIQHYLRRCILFDHVPG